MNKIRIPALLLLISSITVLRFFAFFRANQKISRVEYANEFIDLANRHTMYDDFDEKSSISSGLKMEQDNIDPWDIVKCVNINREKTECEKKDSTYDDECKKKKKECENMEYLANVIKNDPDKSYITNDAAERVPMELYNCIKDKEDKEGKGGSLLVYEKYGKCYDDVKSKFDTFVESKSIWGNCTEWGKFTEWGRCTEWGKCTELCDTDTNLLLSIGSTAIATFDLVYTCFRILGDNRNQPLSVLTRIIPPIATAFMLNAVIPSSYFIKDHESPDPEKFPVLQVIGNSYDKIVNESIESADLLYRCVNMALIAGLVFHAINVVGSELVQRCLEDISSERESREVPMTVITNASQELPPSLGDSRNDARSGGQSIDV